jgi:hypothetical protein
MSPFMTVFLPIFMTFGPYRKGISVVGPFYKKTVFRKAAVAYNNVYRKLFNLKRGTSHFSIMS